MNNDSSKTSTHAFGTKKLKKKTYATHMDL